MEQAIRLSGAERPVTTAVVNPRKPKQGTTREEKKAASEEKKCERSQFSAVLPGVLQIRE